MWRVPTDGSQKATQNAKRAQRPASLQRFHGDGRRGPHKHTSIKSAESTRKALSVCYSRVVGSKPDADAGPHIATDRATRTCSTDTTL
eukprot:scaffold14461_cov118-Isochrysis_galbana.AAC.1